MERRILLYILPWLASGGDWLNLRPLNTGTLIGLVLRSINQDVLHVRLFTSFTHIPYPRRFTCEDGPSRDLLIQKGLCDFQESTVTFLGRVDPVVIILPSRLQHMRQRCGPIYSRCRPRRETPCLSSFATPPVTNCWTPVVRLLFWIFRLGFE